jgi:hypothetical protein
METEKERCTSKAMAIRVYADEMGDLFIGLELTFSVVVCQELCF